MIRRPPRSTLDRSSAASDVYKRQTLLSVINPFSNQLSFEVSSMKTGTVKAEILDQTGKVIRKKEFAITEGVNMLVIDKTDLLSNGVYFLRAESAGTLIQKKILKQNN